MKIEEWTYKQRTFNSGFKKLVVQWFNDMNIYASNYHWWRTDFRV